MLEIEVEVVLEEVVTRISSKIDRYLQKQLLKRVFQKQMFLIVTIYNEVIITSSKFLRNTSGGVHI